MPSKPVLSDEELRESRALLETLNSKLANIEYRLLKDRDEKGTSI